MRKLCAMILAAGLLAGCGLSPHETVDMFGVATGADKKPWSSSFCAIQRAAQAECEQNKRDDCTKPIFYPNCF